MCGHICFLNIPMQEAATHVFLFSMGLGRELKVIHVVRLQIELKGRIELTVKAAINDILHLYSLQFALKAPQTSC